VVDAAGAIYVIGGFDHDVWVSTDGGSRTGLGQGNGRGILKGVLAGYSRGTKRVF
jgi:hypothetical protein